MSQTNGYPVAWRGETLYMGSLTKAVKDAFVKWAKPAILTEARETLSMAEYMEFRQEVLAANLKRKDDKDHAPNGGIYWSANPSMAIATALATDAGAIQFNRLLFGDQVKDWPDDKLWEMLQEKDADPNSDWRLAIDLIWEESDPKVQKPSDTSGGEKVAPASTPS